MVCISTCTKIYKYVFLTEQKGIHVRVERRSSALVKKPANLKCQFHDIKVRSNDAE